MFRCRCGNITDKEGKDCGRCYAESFTTYTERFSARPPAIDIEGLDWDIIEIEQLYKEVYTDAIKELLRA